MAADEKTHLNISSCTHFTVFHLQYMVLWLVLGDASRSTGSRCMGYIGMLMIISIMLMFIAMMVMCG